MSAEVWDTVEGHLTAGRVKPRSRVRPSDLELAASWVEAYEIDAADSPEMAQELATAAAWLWAEAGRRRAAAERRRAGRAT